MKAGSKCILLLTFQLGFPEMKNSMTRANFVPRAFFAGEGTGTKPSPAENPGNEAFIAYLLYLKFVSLSLFEMPFRTR